MVLIEADRIHALGKKAAAVGIDQPEHAVALVHAKKSAAAETVIGDPAPFGSLQADTPTAAQRWLVYRTGRPGTLDISQDRPVIVRTIVITPRTLPGRKGEQ